MSSILVVSAVTFAAFYVWLAVRMVSALTAIASSPGMTVPTEHVAADTAASLVAVLFAMLVSAPTYFLLAFGLLSRTLRSWPNAPFTANSAARQIKNAFTKTILQRMTEGDDRWTIGNESRPRA